MAQLDLYIARLAARNYLLTNLLLLGLFCFFDIAVQMEDVGEGDYAIGQALLFALCQIPRRLLDLTPFTVLLTSVLTLGGLSVHSELTAMRSFGLSPVRITASLLKAGVVLLAGLIVVGSFVAPALQQYAYQMRTAALAASSGAGSTGLWAKAGQDIIHIDRMMNGRIPTDIDILHFSAPNRLESFLHAERADIMNSGEWRLQQVTRKIFTDSGERVERLPKMIWQPSLTERQLDILDQPAASLSPVDLVRYIRYLHSQGQNALRFSLALWQKLVMPLLAAAMIFLSAPLVFRPGRTANLGMRVAISAGIGLAIYALTQFAANLTLLFQLNPALLTLTPAAVLLLLAVDWLRRIA
ncbi:MAG: LPS export ABC transporter permease LptG [Salinisphaera sp.]|nr:LPS export ABC transporter permease LptG [Salinisphaera sp.]